MAIKLCGFNDNVTDRRHKIVFHSLRHTFASWLVQQDIHLSVISRLLGHSDIQLTMRYAHLSLNQEKKAVELLSGALG